MNERGWFLRLALLTCCTGYVLGLVLIGRWLGVWAFMAVVSFGGLLAVTLTLEPADPPGDPKPARARRFGRPRTRPYEGIDQ